TSWSPRCTSAWFRLPVSRARSVRWSSRAGSPTSSAWSPRPPNAAPDFRTAGAPSRVTGAPRPRDGGAADATPAERFDAARHPKIDVHRFVELLSLRCRPDRRRVSREPRGPVDQGSDDSWHRSDEIPTRRPATEAIDHSKSGGLARQRVYESRRKM